MGEEVKKSRPAPDPNSAKFKLGMIAAKAYSDCAEAKDIFSHCIASPETFGRTGVCDAVTINKANILILKYVSK